MACVCTGPHTMALAQQRDRIICPSSPPLHGGGSALDTELLGRGVAINSGSHQRVGWPGRGAHELGESRLWRKLRVKPGAERPLTVPGDSVGHSVQPGGPWKQGVRLTTHGEEEMAYLRLGGNARPPYLPHKASPVLEECGQTGQPHRETNVGSLGECPPAPRQTGNGPVL